MQQEIVRQYSVPNWLYTAVNVPGGEFLRVEPDAFANSTWARMRLIALTFGSPNPTAYHSGVPQEHPTWTNRLLMDIGKSGCSDMNLVSGTISSLCAPQRRVRTIMGMANMGRSYRFQNPYVLPRDEGLRVSVEWIHPTYNTTYDDLAYATGPAASGEVTFIAKGYGPDGYPMMLAARCDSMPHFGDATLMNSADLFNRGKTEMYITELCFKDVDVYTTGSGRDVEFLVGHGFSFAWQVNPTNPTFTQWMPQPRHIPTALLTPLIRNFDAGAESPLAYFFPPDTFLDPKQALGIRLANDDSGAIELHVCLVGELEVK